MTSDRPRAPEAARHPDAINPYAASRTGESLVDPPQTSSGVPSGKRRYQMRLTWEDRAALLRSVFPGRASSILGGVLWLKSVLTWGSTLPLYLQGGVLADWVNVLMLLVALGNVAVAILAIYTEWLTWQYANLVRLLAGGETADASPWSRLHLRLAWLGVLLLAMSLVNEMAAWVLERAVQNSL